MKSRKILLASLLVAMGANAAETSVPAADLVSVKDPAYLGRFIGAKALTHTAADFDSKNFIGCCFVMVSKNRRVELVANN